MVKVPGLTNSCYTVDYYPLGEVAFYSTKYGHKKLFARYMTRSVLTVLIFLHDEKRRVYRRIELPSIIVKGNREFGLATPDLAGKMDYIGNYFENTRAGSISYIDPDLCKGRPNKNGFH